MPKIVEEQVEYLKGLEHRVKYIRCDNAGEHQGKLQKVCEKFGIELEYTAPYTPQMNGVIERIIAVLLNGARASLYAANLTEDSRGKLWAKAVSYNEDVRNSMSTTRSVDSANTMFFGKLPSFLKSMVEFGRVGYVTIRGAKIKNKIEERSIKCIMVDYARNHSGDTYRLYNPTTNRIISSRDVKWADWKPTDPRNNIDIFVKYDPADIVPGVDEMVVEIVKPPEINKTELHVIPDDGD